MWAGRPSMLLCRWVDWIRSCAATEQQNSSSRGFCLLSVCSGYGAVGKWLRILLMHIVVVLQNRAKFLSTTMQLLGHKQPVMMCLHIEAY